MQRGDSNVHPMPGSAPIVEHSDDGATVTLLSPTAMPLASGYLWNSQMLARFNCRGFAQVQYMQPEPTSYSRGPVLEASTFMQPEMGHYAHHPGRFVYIRDEDSGFCFSVPHEPMRIALQNFRFSVRDNSIAWHIEHDSLAIEWRVRLPSDTVAELWTLTIRNLRGVERRLSVFPVFSLGYISWLSQGAQFDAARNAIVAYSVPPYQSLDDYPTIQRQKSLTYLAANRAPVAFETVQNLFEGEGGLVAPDALRRPFLQNHEAAYETPIAAMQFDMPLAAQGEMSIDFCFGPARDTDEVSTCCKRLLGSRATPNRRRQRQSAMAGQKTPETRLDHFANHWLMRQVDYHGELHRLTTDPQTRNFLQDAIGQLFVDPNRCIDVIRRVLEQQHDDGGLPDGILLRPDAELKYINQVPHTDHAVWLPILVTAYLDETNDYLLLDHVVTGATNRATIRERIDNAIDWLLSNLDERHLSLIAQGDWCDPMNMVGHHGLGVSGWLSMATVYAVNLWCRVCVHEGRNDRSEALLIHTRKIADAVDSLLWADDRYARGITDAGRVFGTTADSAGKIFLNTQSWAMLAGIPDNDRLDRLKHAVESELQTQFGPMMLTPPYQSMVEDIGRLTQKHPGYAENGSVYSHASMFYVYALYLNRDADLAFTTLMKSIPGVDEDDLLRRGQLPVFLPNYYRGAVKEYPRTAGRSSQLFHTGAVSWLARILIEQLFGLRGCESGLKVDPQLPVHWQSATLVRRFRGAEFDVHYRRDGQEFRIEIDGQSHDDSVVRDIRAGHRYEVCVMLPEHSV